MFSRLIIGNFKSIGPTVEIDLRPITLLFGPNTAGKSSILHAVHYLVELLRGDPRSVYATSLSGAKFNLGGFDHVVHGRDPARRMTLGIEFDRALEANWNEAVPSILSPDQFLVDGEDADVLRCRIRSYRITVTVGRPSDDARARPAVLSTEVEINHEPLAAIALAATSDAGIQRSVRLNLRHPILAEPLGDASGPPVVGTHVQHWLVPLAIAALERDVLESDGVIELPVWFSEAEPFVIRYDEDALPRPGSLIGVSRDEHAFKSAVDPTAAATLEQVLSVLLAEPLRHAADCGKQMVHVGPLRALPPRDDEYIGDADGTATWYDGGGAWQTLELAAAPERLAGGLVARTLGDINVFLHDGGLLGTGLVLKFVRERRFRDNREEIEQIDLENCAFEDPTDAAPLPPVSPFPSLFERPAVELEAMSKEQLLALLYDIRDSAERLPHRDRLVLRDENRGIELTLQDVGVGVAQAIPVLVAIFDNAVRSIRMVEQPELHLHPKAQVALGDAMIVGARQRRWGEAAIFETHSEHLLLRLLRRIRETGSERLAEDALVRLEAEHLAIIYVEPTVGGASVRRLRVDESGAFHDKWPQGFFDERAEELFS